MGRGGGGRGAELPPHRAELQELKSRGFRQTEGKVCMLTKGQPKGNTS